MLLPGDLRSLFWDVDFERLDVERDRDFILPRVLEFGRFSDIRWMIAEYGQDAVHNFLREQGHPELSRRTLNFWRLFFDAREETWKSSPEWRRSSSAPWRG